MQEVYHQNNFNILISRIISAITNVCLGCCTITSNRLKINIFLEKFLHSAGSKPRGPSHKGPAKTAQPKGTMHLAKRDQDPKGTMTKRDQLKKNLTGATRAMYLASGDCQLS